MKGLLILLAILGAVLLTLHFFVAGVNRATAVFAETERQLEREYFERYEDY